MKKVLSAALLSQTILSVLAAGAIALFTSAPASTQSTGDLAGRTSDEVERFCGNIVDAARDRRYSLQAAELAQLQKDVDARIRMLEEKRAEYEEWLARREAFMKNAEESVVQIYRKMKPDAAASQLSELRAEIAASILMKLDARVSSVILNEMETKAAATLTSIMVSAARPKDPS
jgi:flagellar motility protein MotE (MotC chaperone)